jgi:uroporphyrinogen decarboxylase
MVPVAAVGVGVRIVANQGPTIDEPFTSEADFSRLRQLEPAEDVPYTLETIRLLLRELEVPLVGFAGAPFTLASYLIEGQPSRDHTKTKALMLDQPATWAGFMRGLTEHIVLPYLRAQAEAGVHAIQLFDSWAGTLSPEDYRAHVLPWSSRIFEGLREYDLPLIHFGTGTGELLPMMREAGATVVGVDWRVPLDVAWERIGHDAGIQGNLEPAACLGRWEVVERKATSVLRRAANRPGHVFNLGHGVLPQTPPENLQRLVDLVHERTAR